MCLLLIFSKAVCNHKQNIRANIKEVQKELRKKEYK